MCGRPLDLPLDPGGCHGKFGDSSYYGDWVDSEQTNKQTDKQTFFFIYIDNKITITYHPYIGHSTWWTYLETVSDSAQQVHLGVSLCLLLFPRASITFQLDMYWLQFKKYTESLSESLRKGCRIGVDIENRCITDIYLKSKSVSLPLLHRLK
jgi:hypothetical protein